MTHRTIHRTERAPMFGRLRRMLGKHSTHALDCLTARVRRGKYRDRYPHTMMAERIAPSAPRWHVAHRPCTGNPREPGCVGVHVVTLHLDPLGLPIIVTPSAKGFAAATKLADALNRAYGIEPASGFDVAALLGLQFDCMPAPARRRPTVMPAETVHPIF